MSQRLLRDLTLACACLAATGPLRAQRPAHAQATVNDARSHGQVGDAFLSLNEAIQLNNLTLTLPQLSPQEQSQIYGLGDIAFVQLDALAAPKITFERDLDVIDDNYHGFIVLGLNGIPVIDMGTTNGFVSRSNYSDFRRLHLKGGKIGITITQTSTIYGSSLEDLTLEGQSVAGIKLMFPTDGGLTRILMGRCTFLNLPQALAFDDVGSNRNTTVFMSDIAIVGGQKGIEFTFGPAGAASLLWERFDINGTTDGIRFARISGADADGTAINLEARHLHITGGTDGLTLFGSPTGQSQMLIQSSDFAGSRTSLTLDPGGAWLDANIEEVRTTGVVAISAGRKGKVTIANSRLSQGSVDLTSEGAPMVVTDTILDGVATRLQGLAPARIEESRLINGSVLGAPGAPLTIQRCHAAGTTVGNDVTLVAARTAPQIGSVDVSTLTPILGGNLTLLADLPPNVSGFWFFGTTALYPTLGPEPFHFYMDLARLVLIPSAVRLKAGTNIPIPNDPPLRGADLFFQMAVIPDLGFDAPALSLPPGRRVVIQ